MISKSQTQEHSNSKPTIIIKGQSARTGNGIQPIERQEGVFEQVKYVEGKSFSGKGVTNIWGELLFGF